MSDVLAELMARRGYGRLQSTAVLADAWSQAVGEPLAKDTCVGAVGRGVLEVVATSSTLVQELTFRRQELLSELARRLPDERITGLRFRVGPIQ